MPVAVAALGGPFSLSAAMSWHFRHARRSKPTMSIPSPDSLTALKALTPDELVSYVVHNLRTSEVAFVNSAKAIIALGGDTKANRAALRDKGCATSSIKNAIQAVEVWESVVTGGHADESWFDKQSYGSFVVINRAVKKAVIDGLGGAGHLAAAGVFTKSRTHAAVWCEDFTAPPTPKVTPKAAPVAATVAEVAASMPIASETVAATAPATTATPAAPAVATVTATTKTETPAEGDKAVKPSAETAALLALEKAVAYAVAFIELATNEVAVGALIEKVAAASLTIAAARDKRFPAKAAASTADLAALKATVEQHAAA